MKLLSTPISLLAIALLKGGVAPVVAHSVSGQLSNKNANAVTKSTFQFLTSVYGKHILSGQQSADSYQWVISNIGKAPAIVGLDFMDYSPGRVAYGAKGTDTDNALSLDAQGALIDFVWHWGAPSGLYNTAAEPWYSGFYSAASSFNLGNALANTGGSDYALLLRDMDAIATQLKRLQSANVPVLWRPLHEAEGGWFWWGRNGDYTSCKKLYRLMYDRFTNYHGLNNLIWVWNSQSSNWYPGDDVVDILSVDVYAQGDHGSSSSNYNALISLGGDKKPVALAEVGSIPDPAQLVANKADWLYFVTWNGDFISGGTWNSKSFISSVYSNSYVLNRDGIKGFKTYNGGTVATTTTKAATTTTKATTTTAGGGGGGGGGGAALYGQCGGTGWTGATSCASGTCKAVSPPWYYQCLP